MDAEDLICPLARDGVLVAIKKVLESDEYKTAKTTVILSEEQWKY